MAWFPCKSGTGMPSGLQTQMDAVLNKKFGTSTTYPATDWPDTVNLMGVLPVRTATKGAICTFSDGADGVPCPSVLCEINPLQASGTPSPSNPLAISGFTGLTLTKCGKNFLPTSLPTNTINATFTSNGVITSAVNARVFAIEVNKNVDFIYSCETRTTVIIGLSDKLPEVNDTITYVGTMTNFDNKTFNTGNNKYIVIGVMNSSVVETFTTNKVMIEVGSTATTYVPYTAPTTLSVTWQSEAGTVYGGTLDVVSGVLTVTHTYMKSSSWGQYNQNNGFKAWRLDNQLLSKYSTSGAKDINNMGIEFGSFSSSNMTMNKIQLPKSSNSIFLALDENYSPNDLEIVYELATPQTYQLTPQEVTTLLATNNFFHDANGDTQVQYRATSAVVDSKTITANGTYNASADNLDGYSSVSVNVAPNVGTKSITQNGTYTASSESLDGYSEVTVNVSVGEIFSNKYSFTNTPATINKCIIDYAHNSDSLWAHSGSSYAICADSNGNIYYDTTLNAIVRTGSGYYAEITSLGIVASQFRTQDTASMSWTSEAWVNSTSQVNVADLSKYIIANTFDILDENGNVVLPANCSLSDLGLA